MNSKFKLIEMAYRPLQGELKKKKKHNQNIKEKKNSDRFIVNALKELLAMVR